MKFYKETEFKDSTIGRIPTNWEIKTLIDTVGGKDDLVVAGPFGSNLKVVDYRDKGVPIIRLQNIDYGEFVNKDIKYTSFEKAQELSYHSFIKGDVVLAKLGDPIGKTCIVPDFLEKGIVVADVVRIRVDEKGADKRYVMQVLNSKVVSSQLTRGVIGTTRPRVNLNQVRELIMPVSPISEQHAIAEVLSCADLAIQNTDVVIAKTERLKKGLMQKLLTKGIGHEEFKETEIGRIPKDWKLVSIYDIKSNINGAIVSGPFGSNIGKRFFVKEGIPVIRGNNLTLGEHLFVDDGFVYITEEKAEELKSCEALPNDLIFTAAGTLGQVGIIPKNGRFSRYIISNKQLRARIDESRALPLFLFYWFTSTIIKRTIRRRKTGTSIPVINLGTLRSLPIPLPESVEEQRQICEVLSTVDGKLQLEREQRAKLERIKQGLMVLLLTGKIRVRVD